MTTIKFGTDGWRARIAEDYTFTNVEIVTQALADYIKTIAKNNPPRLSVGYDRRFASEHFAARTAEVLAGNGFIVDLFEQDVPTPVVSFEVLRQKLDGGVVITASHNPPDFNGYKFKASFGGAATPEITTEIESHLGKNKPARISLAEGQASGLINVVAVNDNYRKHIAGITAANATRACGRSPVSEC